MKITIITPSYNQGQFIQKCINSIKAQGGSVEHIILDNCSNDETREILDQYRNNPGNIEVRIIIEPDKGQTAAINRGFSMATGDIVCWLNTDEWYHPGTLELIREFFQKHPEVDVVFGDCDFVDAKGALIKQKRELFYSEAMLLYYGCYIPSCSTFIRRKVIDAGVYLRPEFKVTMDYDWYMHMAKERFRFKHISTSLASFTWHDSNISSIYVERRKLERRIVQDMYSGIKGPAWFRGGVYGFFRILWLAVRVISRKVA